MAETPFKMRSGNSPLKQTEDWFNVRGYLKGEQGLIPDWKGESTSETASKVSTSIQKGHGKVKQVVKNMLSPKMTKNKNRKNINDLRREVDFKVERRALEKMTSKPRVNVEKIPTLGPKKLPVNNDSKPSKGRYNT